MFHLVKGDTREDFELEILKGMHRLRKRIFIDEQGWKTGDGVYVTNGMEHDDFDGDDIFYLISTTEDGEVNAGTRLTPIDKPNLLCDVYKHLIEEPINRSPTIWETSRFCADPKKAPKNIMAQLVAGMLEFGLAHEVENFVSLSDTRIEKPLDKLGWPRERLGGTEPTGEKTKRNLDVLAAGEIFDVSYQSLSNVRKAGKIPGPLLPELLKQANSAQNFQQPSNQKGLTEHGLT